MKPNLPALICNILALTALSLLTWMAAYDWLLDRHARSSNEMTPRLCAAVPGCTRLSFHHRYDWRSGERSIHWHIEGKINQADAFQKLELALAGESWANRVALTRGQWKRDVTGKTGKES